MIAPGQLQSSVIKNFGEKDLKMTLSELGTIFACSYLGIQTLIGFISSIVAVSAVRTVDPSAEKPSCLKVIRLWVKTTYKMRNVYSSFAVHIFDFMTDILVISEWYDAEKVSNGGPVEHVDSRLMAQVSIGVLIFYKIISSLAIFLITNYSFTRAFLQFWDLLVFEEMFIGHKRIVSNINNQNSMQFARKHLFVYPCTKTRVLFVF